MKKILVFMMLLTLFSCSVGWAGFVNNSGTSGADSITIAFYSLDSLGNVIDIAAGDSIFIQVHTPEGAVAVEDSGNGGGTGLAGALTTNDFSGTTLYYYSDAVADIDGSPSQGVYTYILTVKDITGTGWYTPHRIVANSNL
jgi:hypothetical protein